MLKIKLLNPQAKVPVRASKGAGGYDLYSAEEMTIAPQTRQLVDTGIAIAIADGYYGRIAPRSGLAVRGIDVKAGVIDSDYRGPVKVLLKNDTDNKFKVKVGERIAQLIITKIATPEILVVEDLDETTRGDNGFGSTGSF